MTVREAFVVPMLPNARSSKDYRDKQLVEPVA